MTNSATYRWLAIAIAAAGVGPVFGQADQLPPVAFVTAVTGGGATRGDDGPQIEPQSGRFSDETCGLRIGESVFTADDGTAVVTLPEFRAMVHLDASTELKIISAGLGENDVPVGLELIRGTAYILRSGSQDKWMLVTASTRQGEGYVLSKDASLQITATRTDAAFACTRGQATFFAGKPPEGALIDAQHAIIADTGIALPTGHRIAVSEPDLTTPDVETGDRADGSISNDLYAFGLSQSGGWVRSAEAGDFTPVRGSSRAAAEAFSAEIGVQQQAFDQPRGQVVSAAPANVTRAVTSNPISTAQTLIQSGIPTSVVIGQRLRRSRVIGNPGGAGTGGLRVNPNVEQLIRLPGGRRRR
jgi:hypothetical protein